MAVARPTTRASHSSSTSRSDRKSVVVSSTCFSTIKKPEISCVSEGRDDNGRGLGRMRSDCAFMPNSVMNQSNANGKILTFLSA